MLADQRSGVFGVGWQRDAQRGVGEVRAGRAPGRVADVLGQLVQADAQLLGQADIALHPPAARAVGTLGNGGAQGLLAAGRQPAVQGGDEQGRERDGGGAGELVELAGELGSSASEVWIGRPAP